MKKILVVVCLIFLTAPTFAITYGNYQNDSCGLLDAFDFNFGKNKKDKNFIEVKSGCAEGSTERKKEERYKDKNYNEYETYKRMLYYETVEY